MRTSLLVGTALTITTALVVLISGGLDLDLEPVALLGLTTGAVIALSQDRTAALRVLGFVAGIGIALLGYMGRAAALPDSPGGRAIAAAAVVLALTVVVAATRDRLPLWATLLGAGTFAGAYERVYAAAPPELLSTSVETLTVLLLTVAAGFFAGTLTRSSTPRTVSAAAEDTRALPRQKRVHDSEVELDELLAS